MNCENCKNQIAEKQLYCANCGQKLILERYTFQNMILEPLKSFVLGNKNLIPTLIKLLINPGKHINIYLTKDRMQIYQPFNLLIFIGTLTTLLSLRYHFFANELTSSTSQHLQPLHSGIQIIDQQHLFLERFFHYAEDFATIINFISIPIFSFFSWLVFRKCQPSTNYAENMIINSYITSVQWFVLLLFVPFIEFYAGIKVVVIPIYIGLTIIYNIWVYYDYYKEIKFVLLRGISVVIFSYCTQFMVNVVLFYFIEPYVEVIDKFNLI